MLKRIGDITLYEIEKICRANTICSTCPLVKACASSELPLENTLISKDLLDFEAEIQVETK